MAATAVVERAIIDVVETCQSRGVQVGIFTETVEMAQFWMQKGIRYIAYSVDLGLLYGRCKEAIVQLQGG